MQIQNPTAVWIARTAVAQDDTSGDGMHPRVLVDGFEIAKRATLQFLEKFKTPVVMGTEPDKEILKMVARSDVRTKLYESLADQLTDIVANAVLCIRKPEEAIDLFMVEIMHMRHKFDVDTRLVEGLVLDHGSRHPDMKRRAENCYILTCNVSLEYEKEAERGNGFLAEERRSVDERVQKIIDLKNKVCAGNDNNFVVINQKGIDPPSLDQLARAGMYKRRLEAGILRGLMIIALRRAKRRNMETFGANDHTIAQIKDAVRDGLRAVKNTIEDEAVVLGAGAFEVAARQHLINEVKKTVKGEWKLLLMPSLLYQRRLAENSGLDTQDVIIGRHDKGNVVGLNQHTGEPVDPQMEGIFDNYSVKRQIINSGPVIASQLLLVDEVIRAGRNMRKPN
ncbi:T-complex protein 1 subunit zeta [Datura stramonium]|uniref:T-complex protein 1 subunit zeta n=1 Tax=Datura stramonium TaxID=4076 RepID=A0ABS8UYE9_DATST|nr:T-complex protein 1 subunit zeta [Datura stramonium]